jgi:hypothetical protein
VNLTIIVLVDPLYHSEGLQRILRQVCLVLELTQVHHDLGQVVCVGILLQGTEGVHGLHLVLDCLLKVLRLVKDASHLQIGVS